MWICKYCESENSESEKVCVCCGRDREVRVSEKSDQNDVINGRQQGIKTHQNNSQQSQTNTTQSESQPKNEGKQKLAAKYTVIITVVATLATILAVVVVGYFYYHKWSPATCQKPETCLICGKTRGEPAPHTPVKDAEVAAKCEETGLTEGSHCAVCGTILTTQKTIPATDHDWTEATYTTPKTCKICGKTSGGVRQIKAGDTMFFGSYEQDNNTSDGKEEIEWLILAIDGNKALLISKYALDAKAYNDHYEDITWADCTLRTWLNEDFYNVAFSAAEQKQIIITTVSADKNPESNTDPGRSIVDKVFLLSITETEKYFLTDEARKCAPTAYAKAQGGWTSDGYKTADGAATCWWWLRSPGPSQSTAAYVYRGGSVGYDGYGVYNDNLCVRPALWINLDS